MRCSEKVRSHFLDEQVSFIVPIFVLPYTEVQVGAIGCYVVRNNSDQGLVSTFTSPTELVMLLPTITP
jgi:hypothetical protein